MSNTAKVIKGGTPTVEEEREKLGV